MGHAVDSSYAAGILVQFSAATISTGVRPTADRSRRDVPGTLWIRAGFRRVQSGFSCAETIFYPCRKIRANHNRTVLSILLHNRAATLWAGIARPLAATEKDIVLCQSIHVLARAC